MTTPTGPAPRLPLTARTPEDVLAVVPVVLGFEPDESVAMLTFGGSETFHARVDLHPPGGAAEVVDLLLEPALQHSVARVVFVVYGADGPYTRSLVRGLRDGFGRADIDVVEVLRAHEGRWFAPGRRDAPAAGVAYRIDHHLFRAQAVVEGIVVHGSRAELQAVLQPSGPAVEEVARAVRSAVPSSPGEIADLVDVRLETGRFSAVELARVLLGLLEQPGRDAAWATMTRDIAQLHVRLWTDAVQRAPDDLVSAPAAVLAVAAWLAGHGALAWCAVDRCRAVDPGSSLAGLVAELLSGAVSPSVWGEGPSAQAG